MTQAGLMAGGVEFATSIVILSNPSSFHRRGIDRHTGNEHLMDAEAIMIASKIRSFFLTGKDQPHLMLELVHNQNVVLVDDLVEEQDGQMEAALYAAGGVYSNSILDCLVCQAHFNPAILQVLTAFLGKSDNVQLTLSYSRQGIKPLKDKHSRKAIREKKAAASHHQLMLLVVPEQYVGHRYHELLSGLAQQSCIALGLYRAPGVQDSPMGFVATNPLPETILCSGDRMYVITCEFEYV